MHENVARFLFCCTLVSLLRSTNPIREGDGSHMLEAWLGDEFARRSSLSRNRSQFSTGLTVRRYRLACLLHTGAAVALLVWLW